MTTRRDTPKPAAGAGREQDQLARLGLAPGASPEQVDAAHATLVNFLAAAPRPVRPWARRQLVEVEAAYAGLAREVPLTRQPGAAASGYVAADAEDAEEFLDALDDTDRAAPRRSGVQSRRRTTIEPNRLAGPRLTLSQQGGLRRLGLGAGVLAIALVGIVGVYKLGEPVVPGLTGSPAPGATAAGLDRARVSALMAKLAANPRDIATLRELADAYYVAGDNAGSRGWLLQLLEIDPKNLEALLGSGATAYNLDDFPAAEAAWRAVLAIDPKNVDAHYDLGLMYFSKDPPDLVRMREEWNQVVLLAPDSQLASIVKTHMPDPSASPGASGAPSAQPSGAPSAQPSGAPSVAPSSPASPAPSALASPG